MRVFLRSASCIFLFAICTVYSGSITQMSMEHHSLLLDLMRTAELEKGICDVTKPPDISEEILIDMYKAYNNDKSVICSDFNCHGFDDHLQFRPLFAVHPEIKTTGLSGVCAAIMPKKKGHRWVRSAGS